MMIPPTPARRGACRMSANLSRKFFVRLPQNRHPERSASPIDRVTQRLWRGVEGPRRCLIPMLLGAFRPPKPGNRICCDTHLMVTGTSFHALYVKRACMAAENVDVCTGHSKMVASSWFSAAGKTVTGSVVEKLQAARVIKHRRGPSTPRHKRCVTRSIGEGLRSG
jgi:hypothetical protein